MLVFNCFAAATGARLSCRGGRLAGTWRSTKYRAFPAVALEVDVRDVTFVEKKVKRRCCG
jgi:hypothetical protein